MSRIIKIIITTVVLWFVAFTIYTGQPSFFIFIIVCFPPILIIPLSIFHIRCNKSGLWNILFGELLIIVYGILVMKVFGNILLPWLLGASEADFGVVIVQPIFYLFTLLVNPIIQLIISDYKKKKFGNIYTQQEGILPRVINVDDKNI